jgi:septal ring factor EnvC (AmiA/AmiB activator)
MSEKPYKVLGRDNGKEVRQFADGTVVRVPFDAPGVEPVPTEDDKAVNGLKAKLKESQATIKELEKEISAAKAENDKLSGMVKEQADKVTELTNQLAAKPDEEAKPAEEAKPDQAKPDDAKK